MLEQMRKLRNIFACPICRGNMALDGKRIKCMVCDKKFEVKNNIPLLFVSDDDEKQKITKKVRGFYEETPFPNYEGFEDVATLNEMARRSIFAKLLQEQIPYNVNVLEVGCGTGQLTNFLGSVQRNVLGVDMTLNSLRLGQEFKEKNNLANAGFYQMNIFRPIFKERSFDYVISNGVLHHTADPYLAFQNISKLVKKRGYILVGLYNTYGRLLTDARRVIFNVFGDNFRFLDAKLRDRKGGEVKKDTWFRDQYKNPHESKHTVEEVMDWFDKNGFDFINSVPSIRIGDGLTEESRLFAKVSMVSRSEIFISQLLQILPGAKEGGLFIMIGRKL